MWPQDRKGPGAFEARHGARTCRQSSYPCPGKGEGFPLPQLLPSRLPWASRPPAAPTRAPPQRPPAFACRAPGGLLAPRRARSALIGCGAGRPCGRGGRAGGLKALGRALPGWRRRVRRGVGVGLMHCTRYGSPGIPALFPSAAARVLPCCRLAFRAHAVSPGA